MLAFDLIHMYAEELKNRDLSVQILEQHVKNVDFFLQTQIYSLIYCR